MCLEMYNYITNQIVLVSRCFNTVKEVCQFFKELSDSWAGAVDGDD